MSSPPSEPKLRTYFVREDGQEQEVEIKAANAADAAKPFCEGEYPREACEAQDRADERREAEVAALRTRLAAAEARAAELERATQALIDALPKCDECAEPATRAVVRGEGRWCDKHGRVFAAKCAVARAAGALFLEGDPDPGPAPGYPRAAPLRVLAALIGAGAARDEGGAA